MKNLCEKKSCIFSGTSKSAFTLFRWTQESNDEYIGVFANILWKLKASKTHLHYEVISEIPYPEPCDDNVVRMKIKKPKKAAKGKLLYEPAYYEDQLKSYFRFNIDLKSEYSKWKSAHKHFKTNTSMEEAFITQLDQDVVENLFSFICSQNNNISRISSLVEKLCTNYGVKICEYNGKDYFAFPTLEAFCKDDDIESKLRELGFGYRAKYIGTSAQQIIEKGGLKWLQELQSMEYHDAHSNLLTLTGIGPKVADCICLMSLNFLQAIPVDTHIIQIASHYVPEISSKLKSMNLTLYRKIGDAFRDVYGDKAGMAQTVLFCKELDKFKEDKLNKKMKK